MSYKIFISSSFKDLDLVKDLAKRLEETGVKVSSAERGSWTAKISSNHITKQLSGVDEVMIILTENSVDSPWLMFELGVASSLRKRVTPLVVGVETNKLPSLIKSLHYIKYPDLASYIDDLAKRTKAA
jgi:TIR domain